MDLTGFTNQKGKYVWLCGMYKYYFTTGQNVDVKFDASTFILHFLGSPCEHLVYA